VANHYRSDFNIVALGQIVPVRIIDEVAFEALAKSVALRRDGWPEALSEDVAKRLGHFACE
jgi:hypothetical protein